MAATALPPILWALRRVRRAAVRRRRARLGLCMKCGYDLRGSPGRCSECGEAAPARSARAARAAPPANVPLSPMAESAAVGSNGAQPKGEA